MSFLVPLGIMAAGKIGSGLLGKRTNNRAVDYQNSQTRYLEDQRNRDYTSQVNTQNNGLEYLKAVAAARGYNIPQAAFDAASKLNGVTGPMSSGERFASAPMAPKQGLTETLLGPIAEGVTSYGGIKLGQSMAKANNNIANEQSIAQQIIKGVIEGKIDPDILRSLGIGGFERILQSLRGRGGVPNDMGKPSFPNINPTPMEPVG